jgi:hypothetical protein
VLCRPWSLQGRPACVRGSTVRAALKQQEEVLLPALAALAAAAAAAVAAAAAPCVRRQRLGCRLAVRLRSPSSLPLRPHPLARCCFASNYPVDIVMKWPAERLVPVRRPADRSPRNTPLTPTPSNFSPSVPPLQLHWPGASEVVPRSFWSPSFVLPPAPPFMHSSIHIMHLMHHSHSATQPLSDSAAPPFFTFTDSSNHPYSSMFLSFYPSHAGAPEAGRAVH